MVRGARPSRKPHGCPVVEGFPLSAKSVGFARAFAPETESIRVIKVIRAKLHGIRVTGADLNYHGSITLDPEHGQRAGLYPLEFVDIWNKNSGARLSTYVIYGAPGSRCCVLNGAAARTCQVGDEL